MSTRDVGTALGVPPATLKPAEQPTDHKTFDLKKTANEIIQHVHTVCYAGSTNIGKAKTATSQFRHLWKQLSDIITWHEIAYGDNARQIRRTPTEIKEAKTQLTPFKSQQKLIKRLKESSFKRLWDVEQNHFKVGETVQCPPLELFFKKEVFQLLKIENLDYDFITYVLAAIASYLTDIDRMKMSIHETNHDRANEYDRYYLKGLEPTEEKTKERFFSQTIEYVKTICVMNGYGNCGHMADAAFLEAIHRDLPCDITYLRCLDAKKEREEIHVIALGKWPEPGCTIINAWDYENFRQFTWQGVGKTPVLNNHQEYKILFRSEAANKKERAQFKALLAAANYNQWLGWLPRLMRLKQMNDLRDQLKTSLEAIGVLQSSSSLKPNTSLMM